MMQTRIRHTSRNQRLLAACAVAGLATTAVVVAAPAGAAPSNLTRGTCSGHGIVTLQLQHSDPGRLEAGFEVDHVKAGSVWNVRLTHNGVAYFNGRRTAVGGTFSVDRVLIDQSGLDTISGRARNLATGQLCTVTGKI